MSADRLRVVPMDVASAELEAQADGALREFGVIDVLVNNAAIHYDTWQTASTADMTTVREAFETNLFGAWRLARSLAAPMKRRGYGRIVNVSSGAGSLSDMGGGTPAYSVSKAALNALTCCLAGELSGTGVLVNSVCPGWVATEMGGAGGRPIPEGAAGIVWAATLPEGGPTGGFFRDGVRLAW
jgi:NAD(P)-dependent dehydrogenase (short-subunit alcohol dehydrogenase family)